jgi:hypothetical protein
MKKSVERMECLHHKICCQSETFAGCGNCRHDFIYSRDDWLRDQTARIHGIIIPYDCTISFDPSKCHIAYSREERF